MAAPTVKVATNIPIVGTITYADESHSDKAKAEGWPPQLKLTGHWNGSDGAVYTPTFLLEHLIAVGLLEDNGETSDWGAAKYRVTDQSAVVTILKAETEDGIRWSGEVAGVEQRQSAPASQSAPMPAEVKRQVATNEQKSDRAKFKALVGTFECCFATAESLWPGDTDTATIQACAATLFIEANKRGIVLTPKKVEPAPPAEPEQPYDEYPAALDDNDDELPF